MKKGKIVNILLIAILVFSILNFASSMLVQSSGKDKTKCKSFLVSGADVVPDVTRVGIQAGGDSFATNVTGAFKNNENVDVYGIATATVTTRPGVSQTLSSSRTLLPAHETTYIMISFPGLMYENYFATLISFTPEPIAGPTGGGTGTLTTSPNSGGNGHTSGNTTGKGFDYASVAFPVVGIVVVALGSLGGFMMLKKTRISEQKVRRFSSYEYQDWVFQRLKGHSGSVLDSRKGIDGFTGDNVPVAIKQSDSVDRLQVDSFMNALTQAKTRSGVIVAFGFNSEAYAAVSRAKMNRIDIKLSHR